VKVELRGLEIYGFHGVYAEERSHGQRFLYDVEMEVGDRGADDRLEGAIDYTEVAAAIRQVTTEHRYELLEALATAVADALVERFHPERLVLRARKPEVKPAGLEVEFAAVTVER
jgi:dihydroneopterin aldolase